MDTTAVITFDAETWLAVPRGAMIGRGTLAERHRVDVSERVLLRLTGVLIGMADCAGGVYAPEVLLAWLARCAPSTACCGLGNLRRAGLVAIREESKFKAHPAGLHDGHLPQRLRLRVLE